VQHTDVHSGPLDRRWGLADLTVFTAGTEAAAIRLPGLPVERALALRDALLQGHDRQL
jgi:membrane protein YdbS with pleckstrin-like domain